MSGTSFWDFAERQRRRPEPPPPPPAGAAPQAITVSQLTASIDRAIRSGVPALVLLKGEVSNFKAHNTSGHLYFTLKDKAACIDCVMFNDNAQRVKFTPKDGMELLASGRVSVYAQRGKYQFYVQTLSPLGQGALELARQQIENKLRGEGLFDDARKKPLPRFPQHVVLVTSAQTAAVFDMLKVLSRFAWVRVSVYHVQVQGDGSAEQIAAAITHLCRVQKTFKTDLILLARGGGSLEDLWEFNEEIVARAVAGSKIPVITGIGHDIDLSIADLAADYHAHTPTEAAQVAMRHWRAATDTIDGAALRLRRELRTVLADARRRLAEIERHEFFRRPTDRINQLRQLLDDRQRQLTLATFDRLRRAGERVSRLAARLVERHPRGVINVARVRLDAHAERLRCGIALAHQARMKQIDALAARLHALNPEAVLKRGYSITTLKKGGTVVRDASQVKPGDKLITRLAEGQIESAVDDSRQLRLFE